MILPSAARSLVCLGECTLLSSGPFCCVVEATVSRDAESLPVAMLSLESLDELPLSLELLLPVSDEVPEVLPLEQEDEDDDDEDDDDDDECEDRDLCLERSRTSFRYSLRLLSESSGADIRVL